MSETSVLLVGAFDTGLNAHVALRQRALERLGCHVVSFDLTQQPGLLGRMTGGSLDSRFRKSVEQTKPDLVLLIGGRELSPDAVVAARVGSSGAWVNWIPTHLDGFDEMVPWAEVCDQVMVVGSDIAARAEEVLERSVHVLPLAADPSVYRPHRSRDQYRANVVFAGRATPHREAVLAEVLEFGLAVWGPGWRHTSLRDYCRGELLDRDEFVRAYGGASVALNIHHEPKGSVRGASCNQRVFEIAAIGIPQVVDFRDDLPSYFTPSAHCLTYETVDDLRGCVEAVLLDLPAAEAMAAEARVVALGNHTYMHRLHDLLAHLGLGALAARA